MRVNSIAIGSENADDLKEWYAKTFDVPQDDDGAFVFGDVRLFVFPHSDVRGKAAEPARIMINLYSEDVRSLEAQLREKGVTFIRPVEEEPFGLLGTIADPDGNYLQLVQPAAVTTS